MIAQARVLDLHNESRADDEVEAACRFYCDCLEGRRLTHTTRADGMLFSVGGVLIETGPQRRREASRVLVRVQDPERLAARCWNAGYTVIVDDAIGVLDPFGLRIDLGRDDGHPERPRRTN